MARTTPGLCVVLLAALCLAAASVPAGALAAERAVVLPLQPAPGTDYDGLGPAVQNLVENALVLHAGFEETARASGAWTSRATSAGKSSSHWTREPVWSACAPPWPPSWP